MGNHRVTTSIHVLDTKKPPPPSPFLKIPLEIRDKIFRMLLTTSWTYAESLQGKITESGNQQTLAGITKLVSTGRFNLNPAILRVNKQLAKEAIRILYTANEFIILNIGPLYPQFIIDHFDGREVDIAAYESFAMKDFQSFPAFRKLSQAKVTNRVLTVTIAMRSEKLQLQGSCYTLIITPEVMPHFFENLWICSAGYDFYTNCFLALDFHNKNLSRRNFLNGNILKIWDQIYGFGEVRLTGNMDDVVSNHLKQFRVLGPFEDDIVYNMEILQSSAENSYRNNDFATAYFDWHHLQKYWAYHLRLERIMDRTNNGSPFSQTSETKLTKALSVTASKVGISALGILKILLRLRNYHLAARFAESPNTWLTRTTICTWDVGNYTYITEFLRAKFAFCGALALVAKGRYDNREVFIEDGVVYLRRHSNHYAQRTHKDICKEFCKAIDNELIQRGSRWRCGRSEKVGLKSKGGRDWQLHTGCLPFWDWLEIPGDDPRTESLVAEDASDSSGSWD